MRENTEKRWVVYGLISVGLGLTILAFSTEIPAGGADNYAHFNIARWAFRYPHLFLDHWGKPIFTILTAPFAQFGFVGVRIFNTIAGLATAWFIFLIAKRFNLIFPWLAAALTVFTPIFFVMLSSGMTEVLFAYFLVVSVYLFFENKFITSAIIVSFVFLVRTEGLAFLLLFLIGFILKKQYKAIPFLSTGFLLFSLIGLFFHYHDFWWLITKRPYATGGESVYGSGEWYYFIEKMPFYLGYFIPILLFFGTIVLVAKFIRNGWRFNSSNFYLILLILGCFWGYFFIHSFLWWKGETSAGLLRVMAGVSPLAVLIGMYSIDFLVKRFRSKYVQYAFVIIVVFYTGISAAIFYNHSIKGDLNAEILKRVTNWLKESGNLKHKLVIHNPYFAFSTGVDAWDNEVVQYGFSNNDYPEKNLPDSAIFVWDAQFSANEGRLPLEKIMNNDHFEVIAFFEPEIPFQVLGNRDYKILIFRKLSEVQENNFSILEKLKDEEIEKGIYYIEKYDFEQPIQITDNHHRIKRDSNGNEFVFDLNGSSFSPAFHIAGETFQNDKKNKVRISIDIKLREQVEPNKLLMVFSAEKENKSYHYVASDISEKVKEINVWTKVEFIFKVPNELKEGTVVKSYIWNIDENNVLIDNFKLEISEQTEI